jgi:hypothetical protein
MKAKKAKRGRETSNTGEEKTGNKRIALIQLHTNKSLNNENN